jgi:2-methylcitrate dehydratase PrpD
MTQFLQRAVELIVSTPPQPPEALPFVRLALEDTLAVGFAGWSEPVVRGIAAVVPGGAKFKPAGPATTSALDASLMYGAACHALDYDDVQQASHTHPSAPIAAALVAARRASPEQAGRLASAFAVGMGLNIGLGRVLGFSHYEKGWHATSTIGPLAAAAAVAHYFALDRNASGFALALAAATAGGLQRNFGTMAKPLQAGLAAEAGLRAALLARAGVTADPDIFAAKGYFDLYGGERRGADPDQVQLDVLGEGICVKLYPCCYMTHRPTAAALDARRRLAKAGTPLDRIASVEVRGGKGAFLALRVHDPKTGNDGKFCGPYVVACALLDGEVGLAHFTDAAVQRADVRALMAKVRLVEREAGQFPGQFDSTLRSPIELIARDGGGQVLVQTVREAFPGAPEDPPSVAQRKHKVKDCLAHYSRTTGQAFTYRRFQSFLDRLLLPEAEVKAAMASDD